MSDAGVGAAHVSHCNPPALKVSHVTFAMMSIIIPGELLFHCVVQVLAIANKDWKAVLDSAVAKFRAAGAAEADIHGALKAHSRKDELDLGPDPEPEQPEAKEEVGGCLGKWGGCLGEWGGRMLVGAGPARGWEGGRCRREAKGLGGCLVEGQGE